MGGAIGEWSNKEPLGLALPLGHQSGAHIYTGIFSDPPLDENTLKLRTGALSTPPWPPLAPLTPPDPP